jgi:hypothetical protein
MADPNVGQLITSAWESIVKPEPEDNVFEEYWLLDRLKQGKSFKSHDGGRLIEAHLEYATNSTVASYSDLDPISTTRVDVFDSARFNWKEYAGVVVQSELEDAINQGSGGKFDLLGAKLSNLKKSFYKALNEGCFSDGTGNAGKDIGGLELLVDPTPATGTVGGINAATFSFWRNIQASGAQTAASFDNLRAVMRSVYNQISIGVGGEHPTFGLTTRTVFEGFEGLLLANERFGDKSSGDGGFKNEVLKFKGALLAYDNDCTASSLYWLNEKYLQLNYLKGHWMKMLKEVEPGNQTATIRRCVTIANMSTTSRRKLGVVTAIT